MPISQFYRQDDYFSQRTKIISNEIDTQFNNIVNFLNTNILLTLNNLILDQFTGIKNIALQNAFLLNKGDLTIFWDFLSSDCFAYRSISLIKMEIPPVNSILTSNAQRDYEYLEDINLFPDLDGGKVLISVIDEIPKFGKLTAECFEYNSILAEHVQLGSLTLNNIDSYSGFFLNIPTIKFGPGCLTTMVLEDGEIIFNQLSLGVQPLFSTMVTSNMMPGNYIDNHFDLIFGGNNQFDQNNNQLQYQRLLSPDFLANPAPFPLIKFAVPTINLVDMDSLVGCPAMANNSIKGERLQYKLNGQYFPNCNDLIQNQAIYASHLTPALRLALGLQ